MKMTPFYSVVVVFSKDKKKILLGKRKDDKLWTSPAGGGEEGELPSCAAIRELFEETNIKAKESDLKKLTSLTAKNGKPIFIFTMCIDSSQKIHVKNDPDKEVPSWQWFKLDEMPQLEENRLKTVNMAKMQMNDLIKAVVSTDMRTGTDLRTEDFSQDDRAAQDSGWYNRLMGLMDESELNEPQNIKLENGFEMDVHRIDEGLYSGSIKNEAQDRVLKFAELSIPSLVQTLKAKEFIEKDNKIEEMAAPPEGDSDVKVEADGVGSLRELIDTLRNVHVEGDLNITIKKSVKNLIDELVQKSKPAPKRGKRGFPVGTQRTWSNGVTAIKHADGWVVVGGQHHGKLMGKFKEEAEEHHLDVANKHNVENTSKDVDDLEAQIAKLKADHEEKQKKIKEEHDKLVADLKAKKEAAGKKVKENAKKVEESKAKLEELGAKLAETKKRSEETAKDPQKREGSDQTETKTGKEASPTKGEEGAKQGTDKDGDADRSSEGSSGEDSESEVETDAEGSPREEAEGLLEQQTEYENARKSAVTNLGEDLLDSARHKVAWRTAAEAEKTGQAKKVVMRAKMLKENPVSFDSNYRGNEAESTLKAAYLYQALQSFPTGPDYKLFEGDAYKRRLLGYTEEMKKPEEERRGYESRGIRAAEVPIDSEAKLREEYINTFEKVKAKAKELAESEHIDADNSLRELQKFVGAQISELRTDSTGKQRGYGGGGKISPMAEQLVSFYNNSLGHRMSSARTKANAALKGMDAIEFVEAQKGWTRVAQMKADKAKSIKEALKAGMAGGKPLTASLGIKGEGKKRKEGQITGAAQFYVTDKAEREGPKTNLSNMVEAQKSLTPDGDFKMRGLQYGNSVTDDERVHHTTRLAESLEDLTDILGIPKEMASFNGRLGMAIGARGHGTAMAHYEPGMKVINLTRTNGVGTLAHEWGHFMDDVLGQVNGQKGFLSDVGSFNTQSKTMTDSHKAMVEFKDSEAWQEFKKQVSEHTYKLRRDGVLTPAKSKYWNSTIECFARAFENHVDHKLEQKGRKNTYLSASPKGGFWPTKEMSTKLAGEFDKLIETIKKSGDFKKALDLLDLLESLAKGKSFPVGTVRTYSNGQKMKKMSNGKWETISSSKDGKEEPKEEPTNEQKIEANNKRIAELTAKLKESQKKPEEAKKEPTARDLLREKAKKIREEAETPPKKEEGINEDQQKARERNPSHFARTKDVIEQIGTKTEKEYVKYRKEKMFQDLKQNHPEASDKLIKDSMTRNRVAKRAKDEYKAAIRYAETYGIKTDPKLQENLKEAEKVKEKQAGEYVSKINEDTNMVKSVDFSKTSQKNRDMLIRHLDDSNKIIKSMGIKFKTPLNFKCEQLGNGTKRTRAVYQRRRDEKSVILKDRAAANKSVMHEIGHGLDDALGGGRGFRSEELGSMDPELKAAFTELSDIVTNSAYYVEADKRFARYLTEPTEVFARAFEVHSLVKAEALLAKGEISKDFLDSFLPDIFKQTDPELTKIRQEVKSKAEALSSERDEVKKAQLIKEYRELSSKASSRVKEVGGAFVKVSDDKQKEYKERISALMDKILSSDEIKKALKVWRLRELIKGFSL